MKRILNILACAALLALSSCLNDGNTNNSTNTPSGEKGVVMLNIATRTEEGTVGRDYVLCIYKNEEAKSILVRKYDSSKEEMQKPEYIWLLEGNYTAKVESGKVVNASFNAEENYYYGEANFNIVAGQTANVDVVAVMQNIPVEVVFDQTIIDGCRSGYNVEVKASNNVKLTYTESKKGYFIMPEGVTTLEWAFVGTYVYSNGDEVKINKTGTIENVEPKRGYKLSFKYSKDASGNLGDIVIIVDESTEERDDHVSFNPDPEIRGVGFDWNTPYKYATGERMYIATSLEPFCGVLLTADGRTFDPVNSAVAGVALDGLNTTQLYITLSEEFFNTLPGGAQNIEMCVTDISGGEARKSLPYNLQGVNAYSNDLTNLWLGTGSLTATVYGTPSKVEITMREGNGEWKHYTASANGSETYAATVDGLVTNHTYEYNLIIDGKSVGTSRKFTTEDGAQIPNGGLEDWTTSGKVIIPYYTMANPYWCTGNWGTAMLSKNITQSSDDVRPGTTGTKSAYMDSEYIVMKFAAGNLYVGSWGGMQGTNATVYFGQPFEFNAKPKAIRFWAKFNCGTIDYADGGVGKKGDPDLCKIFCCMTTDVHTVISADANSTTFSPSDANIKSGDARYKKVLYSAYMETTQSQTEWKQFEIPFTFYGSDPNQVPTHLILTYTCSGYGDFFDGSTESWMYVDDIEFVY